MLWLGSQKHIWLGLVVSVFGNVVTTVDNQDNEQGHKREGEGEDKEETRQREQQFVSQTDLVMAQKRTRQANAVRVDGVAGAKGPTQ